MEEHNSRRCLPKILFPVFMFAIIFSLTLIFTWPPAFLIFSTPLWNFHVFLPTKFLSPSSFSVIHEGVNIKNSVEKDTTLLAIFLSKSPGGHAIFFRCIWVAIPVDRVILYSCACEVDGRSTARALYGHVITNFQGWVDLLSYRSPHARASSVWNSAIIIIIRYTKKGL